MQQILKQKKKIRAKTAVSQKAAREKSQKQQEELKKAMAAINEKDKKIAEALDENLKLKEEKKKMSEETSQLFKQIEELKKALVVKESLVKKKKKKPSTSSLCPDDTTAPEEPVYAEAMEELDGPVTHVFTSAADLLSTQHLPDVNIDEEQEALLYGPFSSGDAPTKPSKSMLTEAKESIGKSDTFQGWGQRNILSASVSWVRIRRFNETIAKGKEKLLPKWEGEEAAERDITCTLLSEATQIYIRRILEEAVSSARERGNLDLMRIWHLQYGPKRPPLALQLGCDITRQIKLATGNVATTVQKMEEALLNSPASHIQSSALEHDVISHSTCMEELSIRLHDDKAIFNARSCAKRNYEFYGGKESGSGDHPFGPIPKKNKVTVRDINNYFAVSVIKRAKKWFKSSIHMMYT